MRQAPRDQFRESARAFTEVFRNPNLRRVELSWRTPKVFCSCILCIRSDPLTPSVLDANAVRTHGVMP